MYEMIMTPKEYYYNQFRTDFQFFWKKAPNRLDYVTDEPLFKFSGFVKCGDFDALSDISK